MLLLAGLALSCGGGTADNSGVASVVISGTIDFSPNPQKAVTRTAAVETLTIRATDLSSGTAQEVATNSRQYEVSVTRQTDVNIEVLRSGVVILSRILLRQETASSLPATPINLVTHLQAVTALARSGTGIEADLKSSLAFVNMQLYGKIHPAASDITLASVAARDSQLAVILATYGQLLKAGQGTGAEEALDFINRSLRYSTTDSIKSTYLLEINRASVRVAQLIASAHEGAKNQLYFSPAGFVQMQNGFTSEIIKTALSNAKHVPFYREDTEQLRVAAAGVLFSYKFPRADTLDVLGIEGVAESWLDQPDGPYEIVSGSPAVLNWIPSQKDVGQTRRLELRSRGVNGINSLPKTISITVKNPEIKGLKRKSIGSSNVLSGLVSNADYIFLITASSSSNMHLKRFKTSHVEADGVDTLLSYDYQLIPAAYSPIQDMLLVDKTMYIVGGNGVVAFDTGWVGNSESAPLSKVDTGSATKLMYSSGNVFVAQNDSKTGILKLDRYGSSLTGRVAVTEYLDPTVASSNNFTGFGRSHMLMVDAMTAMVFTANQSFPVQKARIPSSPSAVLLRDNSVFNEELVYQGFSTNLFIHRIVGTNAVSAQLQGITLTGNGLYVNSSYAFKTSANLLSGESLRGAVQAPVEKPDGVDYPLDYRMFSGNMSHAMRNVPEGIEAGKSGAYFYTVGRHPPQSATALWYLKAFKIQPEP